MSIASRGERLWNAIRPAPPAEGPFAVLYQAISPPVLDGVAKPANPHGYRDSAADIAFSLQCAGQTVLTPSRRPEPSSEEDWSFPDTPEGISRAIASGAQVIWANTSLFTAHPLGQVQDRGKLRAVGQRAELMERCENKSICREVSITAGVPVPDQAIVAAGLTAAEVTAVRKRSGLRLPVIVKPIRGRGSEGVLLAESDDRVALHIAGLAATVNGQATRRFGKKFLLEQYLPGTEWTFTVMSAGLYQIGGKVTRLTRPWALPPVIRTGHQDGVMPYSGVTPAVANSRLDPDPGALRSALRHGENLAALMQTTAPIRLDCRRDSDETVRIFDANLKPNMTGPGRPGRNGMTNLVGLAAEALSWKYPDLLTAMAANAISLFDLTH